MTELRKRMTEDMKLHGFAKRTHETTLYAVFKLARFFNKFPDAVSNLNYSLAKPARC